jgi:SAM-dependent methyltransferase
LISKEDVIYAYRLILGRNPENMDVVESYRNTMHSLQDLRSEFIASPEFVSEMAQALDSPKFVRQRHPFNLPKIPIEVEVSNETLVRMFERISGAWEHLGFSDPYWSVLTQPQYRVEKFANNSKQFYESSGPLFRNIVAALKRNDVDITKIENCLEVGCGVGRMTGHLADIFKNIIAVDVSSQHLVKARNYFDSNGYTNIELIQWKNLNQLDEIPDIDLVISVITLQHNPPPIIALLLRKILGALKPEGIAFIQLPTYRNGYFFEAERYLRRPEENKIEMHFLSQSRIFEIINSAKCICLEVREDAMVGDEEKMLSNSFLIKKY